MSDFWMVLADSSRVRIFEGASPVGTLTELHDFTNDTARKKDRDLVTDKPGRFRDEGQGRSAASQDPMEEEIADFARTVSQFIGKNRSSGNFQTLSIVAEPGFLGRLRRELPEQVRSVVLEEVAKNLTSQPPEKAQEHLSRLSL